MIFTKAIAAAIIAFNQYSLANPVPNNAIQLRNFTEGPSVQRRTSGDAVYYNPDGIGACGTVLTPTGMSIVALSSIYFNSAQCGQLITIVGPSASAEAYMLDECYGCQGGDIDLDEFTFQLIGGNLNEPRLSGISWDYV